MNLFKVLFQIIDARIENAIKNKIIKESEDKRDSILNYSNKVLTKYIKR